MADQEQAQEPEVTEAQEGAESTEAEKKARRLELTSYIGSDEFDLDDPDDLSKLKELAEAGFKANKLTEEARKARDEAKNDAQFASSMKHLLNTHPRLRNLVQTVVQTGEYPDSDNLDSDDVDESDGRLKSDIQAMRQQLEALHSEIEETKSSREQERAEQRIDAAIDKQAPWMKKTPELRDMAKVMIALEVDKHGVDPGIATMRVDKVLRKSMNADKQAAYEETKEMAKQSRTVRPNDGSPNQAERQKFTSEDWSPRNRRKTLSKLKDIVLGR